MSELREGKVVRVLPRKVFVEVDGERIPAFLRGQLKSGPRRLTHVVAVGDLVDISMGGRDGSVVEKIHDRRNRISRVDPGSSKREIEHVLASNLDWLVTVVSLAQPRLNFRGLDRLLVLGEISDVAPLVVLNKADIAESYDPRPDELYRGIGYHVVRTSAITGEGLDELRSALTGKVSLFAGPSGVGKSSLLNRLFPDENLKTQPVSEATGKGVHTTTAVQWLALPETGAILDSPGIRSIQPWGLDERNLPSCYPEFGACGPCQFRDCKHRGEPNCGVKGAVESGQINEGRYEGYLRILEGVDKPEWWRRSMSSDD